MKAIICGGRDWGTAPRQRATFAKLMGMLDREFGFTCIIEGGARGVDSLAREWGLKHKIPVMEFPAAWASMGARHAGPARNGWMLRFGQPQLVVAFPGGAGTANMIAQATQAGVRIIDHRDQETHGKF